MDNVHQDSISKPRLSKRKKLLRIGLLVLFVLVAFRIVLPYIVLNFINNRLANIEGYFGHVADLDISLFRGAYTVKELYINVVDTTSKEEIPLFAAELIDISIEWRSLLKGQIVSELDCHTALLSFTNNASEPEQLENDSNDFRLMLQTFTPLKVNRFEVFNGKIQYVDPHSSPPVEIFLDNAHVLASNLSNVEDTTLLPATVTSTADVYGGDLTFNMQINALSQVPTYDMNVEIKNANLVNMNSFFQAYADFDVNKGSLDLYMEVAAKDRKYIGYVKPVISDLDVVGPEDKKDSLLRKLWEAVVGVGGDILENPKTNQLGTKVPIMGTYGDANVGIGYAIMAALSNGFIQGIYPSLDHQVDIDLIDEVEANKSGLFKKIFDSPTAKKKKKD